MSVADSIVQMAQQNNAWSAEQAQKQMDFQREMSNTAHQREIADLQAAGLNPVLSAKLGGASTPSGAAATADTSWLSSYVQALKEFGEGAVSSAVEAAVAASEDDLAKRKSVSDASYNSWATSMPRGTDNSAQSVAGQITSSLQKAVEGVSYSALKKVLGKEGADAIVEARDKISSALDPVKAKVASAVSSALDELRFVSSENRKALASHFSWNANKY